jgi:hypothetical protein
MRYAGFPDPPPASFEGRYVCACGMVEFLLPDVPHVKVTTYQAAAEHSPLGCFAICDECKGKTDPDGYCDVCAIKAVERYEAEHGVRESSAEWLRRRRVSRSLKRSALMLLCAAGAIGLAHFVWVVTR